MRKKKGTNICLYFEEGEAGKCKHYGSYINKLESCRYNCKKLKKREKQGIDLNQYIIGFEVNN